MSTSTVVKGDESVGRVVAALAGYRKHHPTAQVEVKRQNSVSIRARIIDPDFEGIGRAKRHETVWRFIEILSEEDQSQMTMLLLLTPEEKAMSLANLDFDNPIPSSL